MSPTLGELTSPEAVRSAIREFDAIGRDAFLERYGFGKAREFFVEYEGAYYDSKAIVSAAYSYQYPSSEPLREFSGGEATVQPRLEKLGFKVVILPDGYPEGSDVRQDWSPEEVAATVADYFSMLEKELRGEEYNKSQHNRALQKLLRNRSKGAIEFKHANISAVLIELGFPYIDGYKPRGNYQELLKQEIEARLQGDVGIVRAAERAVEAPVIEVPKVKTLDELLVPAPVLARDAKAVFERKPSKRVARKTNWLEVEARNSSLGKAGELFALEVEHRRLWEGGHKQLAKRIEHVSQSRGDGLGYDILSFEPDGRERLIEVKTTRFGDMTPFYASRQEVALSEERGPEFNLYRVFKFRESPKLFMLSGSLRETCRLDPVQFKASLL